MQMAEFIGTHYRDNYYVMMITRFLVFFLGGGD